MDTVTIWNKFNGQMYFFILKKVQDRDATNEIMQNSFLKIHQNIDQLKNQEKVKAWAFQIVRNEIYNHFNNSTKKVEDFNSAPIIQTENYSDFCCFDHFITDLPQEYRTVMTLVYINGMKQKEAASEIGISLANVKARVRRAKAILIMNFKECCKFNLNHEGKLVGESNCSRCN
ncbi:RNA polymerase sigma factor FliA [Arenibacter antarcticus]|uniref:Sigma-70 family RNA polymerase sigma factor n=1 Tax=Arenibacter antarcticus TaxID=2040469 RepID=A0ABW5VDI7_9FLAO|nr:sigma-70 family RNA polymerase sigma factor [Arenibacter sp. H213]MCM4168185.1 RNA polymerase subunit sigma-70 [Arenibacter sp. H213]